MKSRTLVLITLMIVFAMLAIPPWLAGNPNGCRDNRGSLLITDQRGRAVTIPVGFPIKVKWIPADQRGRIITFPIKEKKSA